MKTKKRVAVIVTSNTMATLPNALKKIGKQNLIKLGYEVVFGNNVNSRKYHTGGTLNERLNDFNVALHDPLVEIIMPVFGGYNSNQLLPYLDYNNINSTKKKFIGFSDTTALLLAIEKYTECDVFHGPSFSVLCDPDLHKYTFTSLNKAFSGDMITYNSPEVIASDKWWLKANYGPRDWTLFDGWKVYNKGEATASIKGGNLNTICALAGTPFFPKFEDCILFLEVAECNVPGIFHRNLTQLKQIGVFDSINGLIIGKFPYESNFTNDQHLFYILNDILGEKIEYPVLYEVNCSHVDPMMTIPIGKKARIKAKIIPSLKTNI